MQTTILVTWIGQSITDFSTQVKIPKETHFLTIFSTFLRENCSDRDPQVLILKTPFYNIRNMYLPAFIV